MLFGVKSCSASWDLRVVSAFLKKKYTHLVVAPEPLAIWNKELEDLVLKCSDCSLKFYQKELEYGSFWVLFVIMS